MALVKLAEGPVITAQLTDLGETPVQIGMPVEMVTCKIREDGDERGMLVYGYTLQRARTLGAPEVVKGRKFRLAVRA